MTTHKKFYWDEETIMYFKNMLSYSIVDTKLNVKYHYDEIVNKLIFEFVNNDCELQDEETQQDLIEDLTNQVYNLKN